MAISFIALQLKALIQNYIWQRYRIAILLELNILLSIIFTWFPRIDKLQSTGRFKLQKQKYEARDVLFN